MSNKIDWNEWILQKNAESKLEELKKSDSVILEKSSSPDLYNHKVHKYPSNRPEMTPKQEATHSKLYQNANAGSSHGEETSGEHGSGNFTASAHHYMKTGKALKFKGKDSPAASSSEREHFELPKPAGPKTKLP